MKWTFIDDNGSFVVKDGISRTAYFPLCNERLLAGITSDLAGDLKIDQEHFFLPPVSRINLTNDRSAMNFWLRFKDGLFSLTGNSSTKLNVLWPVKKQVEAGVGWFKLITTSSKAGVKSEFLLFIPPDEDVLLLKVRIRNLRRKSLSFHPIFVSPIYGRSADNIRDHRHVTSLLNRVRFFPDGLVMKPTMSFDEKGHRLNEHIYGLFANQKLNDIFSYYEDVVGEGDLSNPLGLLKSRAERKFADGKEVVGALVFPEVRLEKGGEWTGIVGLFVGKGDGLISRWRRYIKRNIDREFDKTVKFWQGYVDSLKFDFGSCDFSNWLLWVGVQPYLRKVFGCSFLPDFDYGRGGRGWRDLWQDLLGLLLRDPDSAREEIINNFQGVRIDGSNATIIGKKRGEFIADRNRIARVWMDHGVWPWETTRLYIDQTGDWQILFEKVRYFRDGQIFRAQKYDYNWDGYIWLRDREGREYRGTILEHILLQHLVQVLNVGDHGCIRLESADWNDGLDMARERGESVAFTHFYAGNLEEIANLLERLLPVVKDVELLEEMEILLQTPKSVEEKRRVLDDYFTSVQIKGISGNVVNIPLDKLIGILRKKAKELRDLLSTQEVISHGPYKCFNGYYDNLGRKVGCLKKDNVRMTLTGQVFAVMKGTADRKMCEQIAKTVDHFLYDKRLEGYRLNTDFGRIYPELGRAFSFSFGEKENGAIFSHMVVMYANALFRRGFPSLGEKALLSLYSLASSEKANTFPCLSEYYNNLGWGMYSYLTGSASWYILTMFREVLGISSDFGDLFLYPRLTRNMFFNRPYVRVKCSLFSRPVEVIIRNNALLEWEEYVIGRVLLNDKLLAECRSKWCRIKREDFLKFSRKKENRLEVILECAE